MAQTRRLVSITPIEAQSIPSPPNLQFNDKRKYCISCSQLATSQVAFRQYGMIIIERYCSACISNLNLPTIRKEKEGKEKK